MTSPTKNRNKGEKKTQLFWMEKREGDQEREKEQKQILLYMVSSSATILIFFYEIKALP
jgi:hypothetical protein